MIRILFPARVLLLGFSLLVIVGFAPVLADSSSSLEDVRQFTAPAILDDAGADTTATRIVRPGAPGQASREVSTVRPGETYTEADVLFMHGMILHHAQAIEMTELVRGRTDRQDLRQLARRIEIAQEDEIKQMIRWLEQRDEPLPPLPEVIAGVLRDGDGEEDPRHHHDHDDHDENQHHVTISHGEMHGMLTPEQIDELRAASGEEFERLFLQFMIFHHEGAILMVDELFEAEGAGQDSELFAFASHVEVAQSMEITRMHQMLESIQ